MILSKRQIAKCMLKDLVFYGEFIQEYVENQEKGKELDLYNFRTVEDYFIQIIVNHMEGTNHISWDAWFRGATGQRMDEADRGKIFVSNNY